MRLPPFTLLLLAGCPSWPDIPEGCRNFAVTTWAETAAPWNEVDWTTITHIDEPLTVGGAWTRSSDTAAVLCGPTGLEMVRERVVAARATGKMVWLNWSTEELQAIGQLCGAEEIGAGADVLSFDSYGGKWDWWFGKTPDMLDFVLVNLAPGQVMGLVPEGHYVPSLGVKWDTDELSLTNALYFDWAMRHDSGGLIFAIAPFRWGPCADSAGNLCIADQPRLVQTISDLAVQHPRCEGVTL